MKKSAMSQPARRVGRTTILILIAATWAGLLRAQPVVSLSEPVLSFERLDGLSHNTVLSIVQDRDGFLWIGTSDGLNLYDGYEFVYYRHVPEDSSSLSNNTVKTLLEDRTGQLWVGTDEGLHRFDRRTRRFLRYTLRSGASAGGAGAILQVLEDHAGDLWVGGSDGLYRYDRTEDRFVAYRPEATHLHSPRSDEFTSLYEDRDHVLWAGSFDGLLRYDGEADRFIRYDVPPARRYIAVRHRDTAERLWLSDLEGSATFDPATTRSAPLPGDLAGQYVWTVFEDSKGVRWTGTDEGLFRYDPTTGVERHLRVERSPGAYLQNRIKAIYEDRAGILWIGTFSGLYRLDPHVKPFHHLGHRPTDPNSLKGNAVMAVLEDSDGFVWIGTLGGGLNRLDRSTRRLTHYRRAPDRAHTLCNDLIWSLHNDWEGRLWIGTNEGLCALEPGTGRFTRYPLPLDPGTTRQPPIHSIREDRERRLWVATTVGLYRLDPGSGHVRKYTPPDEGPKGSYASFVQSLHFDRNGALWMGTFGGGLYRLDPATEQFARHRLMRGENARLVSEGIWAIHEGTDGTLLLGSDLGLTRFDPKSGTTHHFTQADGLPGSIVYAILAAEGSEFLWLSTNAGLVRFSPREPPDRQLRLFDRGDGLENSEFNRRAAFKGADGTFYFGGLDGLTWFHPASVHDNPYIPPVALTRITTSNRDTTISREPFGLQELVLSYRDYTVSFAFTALNFTNPAQNRYVYQLEGFDEQWTDAGARRYATYTNIPPGSYTFRVMGSNDDGLWNEEGAALAITVMPPFWQTWWFRFLMAGVLVGLLVSAHRYRVARVIELERMRMRIARDLHDDVGSGLSSIALASEMAGRDPRLDDTERRHFALVTNKSRQLATALTDIVWLVDPAQDGLDNLFEHMEEITRTMLAGHEYTFPTAPAPHPIAPVVRRNVYLIYKEILHNILKHAQATKVDVVFDKSGRQLLLTVADNGVGFAEDAAGNGYGLKNMRHRAAQMGASLTIDAAQGAGTTVHLSVRPDRR